MIKAVIFDCFGVLTSDGWLPLKNKYFGDNPDKFEKASQLNRQVDSGQISYDKFAENIGSMAGISASEVKNSIEGNVTDEKILEYIKTLKPRYKIGMLSNAGANWLDRLFSNEQRELFDAIALSYETGVIKPHPRAYQIIAERLGVRPDESVFIDDQKKYAQGAETEGMKFILYKDYPQLKKELERILAPVADD